MLVEYPSDEDEDDAPLSVGAAAAAAAVATAVVKQEAASISGEGPRLQCIRAGFKPALVDRAMQDPHCHTSSEIVSKIFSMQDDLRAELIAMGFPSPLVNKAVDASDSFDVEQLTAQIISFQQQEEKSSLVDVFGADAVGKARKACGIEASDSTLADYILEHPNDKEPDNNVSDEEIAEAIKSLGSDATVETAIEHVLSKRRHQHHLQHDRPGPSRPPPAAAAAAGSPIDFEQMYKDWYEGFRPSSSRKRTRPDPDSSDDDDDDGNLYDRSNRGSRQTGFGIPGGAVIPRTLPARSLPPPFFFFENIANMPKGSWEEISRNLFEIQPEVVNSRWFCAASRPRGYIHNLPLTGRRALPSGPMTIDELIPAMAMYRPKWDDRDKLNCITTCSDRGAKIQADAEGMYHSREIDSKLYNDVKRWNLVWRAPRILAPLEVAEVEIVQGFDVGHTACGGSTADRIRALGNAMQVHTVAWHLSVLKQEFPDGIRVLSLFSGIGGVEVALDKLGIPIKFLVSVESNAESRKVLRAWWSRTRQRGTHIVLEDVRELMSNKLEELAACAGGGFDLIAGGSPCNNFSGNNRSGRTGITGEQSRLFYDYVRILTIAREICRR